jgi:hypothetical protein
MPVDKKPLITILIDMALLIIIIASVYMILTRTDIIWLKNLSSAAIVIAIPAMFFMTYTTFAGDKFKYDETEFMDDENGEDNHEEM